MKLTLSMAMDNDDFRRHPHRAAARILFDAAKKLNNGADYVPLMDINGNKVGELNVERDGR